MEFKATIEKLGGAANWSKWRRQVELLLRHNEVLEIVNGEKSQPDPPGEDAADADCRLHEVMKKAFLKSDALAQLILVSHMNDANCELTATCSSAKTIWDKLLSIYEQSSGQRVDRLMEQFFSSEKSQDEDIATHIARLQRNFHELNDEMKRLVNSELPDLLLMSRIMSTLPSDYFEFKSVWESVPVQDRTINKLTERLRLIEMRLPTRRDESAALVAKSYKKFNRDKGGKAEKFERKCFKCHQPGHIAKNCKNKSKSNGLGGSGASSSDSKQDGNAFMSTFVGVKDDELWLADSGASAHMTSKRNYFLTYEAFVAPKEVQVGNKETILAYGQGIINVEMRVKGNWVKNHLADVWYVPEIGRNLFSIGQTLDKGFVFKADQKECQFIRDGTVQLTGKRTPKNLYVLNMKVKSPEVAAEVYVASMKDTVQLWHERLCHQNKQYVKKFLKNRGMEVNVDEEFCDGCMFGKQHRESFGTRRNRPQNAGVLIHGDVCGPMQEKSIGGAKYFVCFRDDYSKFRRVFFLQSKAEVVSCLEDFLAESVTAGHSIKEFLADGGGEFDNAEVKAVLRSKGIKFRIIMSYTPEQNGAAERENRTLVELARSMLHAKELPLRLWAEAVNTATHVLNRTGPTCVKNKTPCELWFDRPAVEVDHFRIFGTECFVHVPKQKRRKWDRKSNKGFFVGYCDERDGFRIWLKEQNKVIRSRDVVFKMESPLQRKVQLTFGSRKEESGENIDEDSEVQINFGPSNEESVEDIVEDSGSEAIDTDYESVEENPDESIDDSGTDSTSEEEAVVELERGQRDRHPPPRLKDYVCLAECNSPNTYKEAMASSESVYWQGAMEEEMASLAENKTWHLVDLPRGKKAIGNRWVMRVKTKADGTVDRFKARLVAKGYSQKQGIDYDETFSPVARFDTVRSVLSVAAAENLELLQFDVKTAFLYGNLSEEVYMKQPEGFEDATNRVCKLDRSLYGLKQAPRCWNKKFVDFMKSQNLKSSSADPCLFTREKNNKKLIIAIYVDDGLVAGSDKTEILEFVEMLKRKFKITVGSLESFLGMNIRRLEDGSIFVNQSGYTKKILERFRMAESNAVSTPCEQGDSETDSVCVGDKVPYREAVGSLMYLTTATRPDLAFAVSVVSETLEKPTESNWRAVKRIFKYLKGTMDFGLLYQRNWNPGVLEAFSDADFAGDVKTRRSRTGVVCKHSGAAISWMSQKQRSVVLSTTEAEYVAASEGTKEVIWLKRLFSDITELKDTPTLLMDSASAIKLAKNPEFHKRSKHIEVRYHFVREKYRENALNIEHIEGLNQTADVMTKPLARPRFEKLRDMLGVVKI